MELILMSLITVADLVLQLVMILLIASAVMSWLVALNIINTNNQFVASIQYFLYKITEPMLRPIRRFVPHFGGIDISPAILIIGIIFIRLILSGLPSEIR